MAFVWKRSHLILLDHVIRDHLTFLPKVLMGCIARNENGIRD